MYLEYFVKLYKNYNVFNNSLFLFRIIIWDTIIIIPPEQREFGMLLL